MEKPSWKNRRRVIWLTLIFCAGCVGYVLWDGSETVSAQTAVMCSFGLAATVIGSYVFGAAWDDKNHMGTNKDLWNANEREDWSSS